MAEFGENLKNVREQKGYTQQTLADHLYVTRQAVSRWEGGSRYPDLMTAKKMAQFLEVSLDELLTDDDMKLYAEKNAIIESPTAKRGQMILLSLAFMSMLFLSIIQVTNFYFEDGKVLVYTSETPKYFLLTVLLGISVFGALFDRLNAKTTLRIYGCYFGLTLLIGLTHLFTPVEGMNAVSYWGNMILNLLCLIFTICFFTGKRIAGPIPLYISCGVYGVVCITIFIKGLLSDIPMYDGYRNNLMDSTLALLANLIMIALLVVMSYTLHRKRKLSAQ
ncbi:MAG: helix-turn-helix transcriptional regulator [Lachnospiraceae bacterium]|nr:helix-turn-helix transcriptional regulator [Lachnospiraceae bacterium]